MHRKPPVPPVPPAGLVTRRTLLGITAATAVGLGPGGASAKPKTADLERTPIDVLAKPLANFSRVHSQTRFGPLTFRGGLVLSSSSQWFGGWSGLTLGRDGRRMVAVSDAGVWLSAQLEYEGRRPVGLLAARIGPILALDGSNLRRDRDRDAEAICLLDGTLERGTVLIAFEQNSRIGRFPIEDGNLGRPAGYLPTPAETRRLNRNRSFEAVAVLRGGRHRGAVVAFAERFLDPAGHHTGWIWVSGRPERLSLTAKTGFDITDAASLPDGGLLVLERSFSWFAGVGMRLRRLPANEISPGRVIDGEVLLDVDMSYEVDNMEALSVHQGPDGALVVTLLSDDNFNQLLQRNVLLQFTLENDKAARA